MLLSSSRLHSLRIELSVSLACDLSFAILFATSEGDGPNSDSVKISLPAKLDLIGVPNRRGDFIGVPM